ncbi:MAG: response regulator [Bacteroidota bacterium]
MANAYLAKVKRVPIIYIWALIIGAFILAMGFFSSNLFTKLAYEDEKLKLSEEIAIVKAVINPTELKSFAGNQMDTSNVSFKLLQQHLIGFCNSTQHIRYIYLLGKKNQKLFFYIDTESDINKKTAKRKTAIPGEIYYDAPKDFYDVFYRKKQFISEPYKDQWGKFVSTISPIFDEKQNVIGLIGIDMEATNWESTIQSKRMIPIIISLIFLAILALVSVFLRYRIDSEVNVKKMYYQLVSLFNSSKQPIVLFSTDYKILYFNKQAEIVSSVFSKQSLKIGKNIIDCLENEQHKINFTNNTQFLLSGNSMDVNIEYKNRFFTLSYNYIQSTETEIPFISLIISDTTDFNLQNNERLRLKSEMEILSSSFHFAVIYFNERLDVLEINPYFEKKFGHINSEIKDKNIDLIIPNIDNFDVFSLISSKNEDDSKLSSVELIIQTKSGNEIVVIGDFFVTSNDFGKKVYAFVIIDNELLNIRIDELQTELNVSKLTIDNLPGFAYRCKNDKDWTMLSISNGFQVITGYEVADVIMNNRLSFNDIILPKYRTYLFDKWQQCFKTNSNFQEEYEIVDATGNQKWVLERGSGVFDEDHNVIEIEGFITDISEIKNTNELLIAEVDKFKSYIDQAPAGIIQIDKDGEIVRANLHVSQLVEYEIEYLRTIKLATIVHPNSVNTYVVFLKKLLNTGIESEEISLVGKSGKENKVRINGVKFEENEFLVFIVELTEIYQYQDTLQSHYQYLQTIVDSFSIPFCVVNLSDRSITISNIHYQRLVEGDFSDSIEHNLIHCDNSSGEILLNSCLSLKQKVKSEISITNTDGIPTYYELHISPIQNQDGEITQVVEYLVNVTDVKNKYLQLEESIASAMLINSTKSNFFANMSQEIRTPINEIIGISELLINSNMNEYQKNYLQLIHNSSFSLINVINNILDFSKIETGEIELQLEPIVLEDVLESVLELFVPICEQKGLNLTLSVDKSFPYQIVSDEIRLRQLLVNIVGNAVKFTEVGFVSISVKTELILKKTQLLFEIADSGVGIPSEKISQIFGKYTQLNKNIIKQNVGTGLGLAASKMIVTLLNGSIEVTSTIDLGSLFKISIPVEILPDQQLIPTLTNIPFKKILAIISEDSEKNVLLGLCDLFKIEIELCKNGVEALQICSSMYAKNENFDAVIVDYYSTGLNWMDIIYRIDQLSSYHLVFYLICNQSDLIKIEKNTLPPQIKGLFSKPLLPKQFLQVIQQSLSKDQKIEIPIIQVIALSKQVKILVAEDNSINMLIIKEILIATGAELVQAIDGQDAFRKFLIHNPDLIFMDIQMPLMNGFEVTQKIRQYCKENSAQKNPYIIAISADVLKNYKQDYVKLGMNNYISKPYKIEDINNSLKSFLYDSRRQK